MRYFDGAVGGETMPAPGLDALEQIAADVRTIKTVAILWAVLTLIGLVVTVAVVATRS
ncbi:MAG: hypothetical protein FWE71_07600 [Nocardioidaceae bacterium]|nr:hypothetical protein [Nocardioidaceae bacterium]MCL2611852.1 hypothetical protein [Nocardioidaceae bacterium]